MTKTQNVQTQVSNLIKNSFNNNRIVCLICYGSQLAKKHKPQDYDFLLLLDKYKQSDYLKLKNISIDSGYKLDLFIDYLDQIKAKGLNNYQRGRHGTYFFKCLASAKCIIGENFYSINQHKIDHKSIQHDLLYRIEEYFYRIQKIYVNESVNVENLDIVKKYISRICLDLLLFKGDLSYADVNTTHYKTIIKSILSKSNLIKDKSVKTIQSFFETNNVKLLPKIIKSLNSAYIKCYKK